MQGEKITFIGTGMIGSGLAVNAMMGGHPVTLYDVIPTEKVQATVEKILKILVESEAITDEEAAQAASRAHYTNDLEEAVTDAVFIQECLPERLEMKKDMYRAIQEMVADHAVISSSTTGIFPSSLQEGARYPEKIMVGHPYNPSYLMPLVEMCGGKQTVKSTIEFARKIYTDMKKVPVLCKKEHKGFIVNNMNWMIADAAKSLVDEDICSVEDVDKAIMFGPGMRLAVTGQLLTLSLGVEGGFRNLAEKYGLPHTDLDDKIADGLEAAMQNRNAETGRNPEEICKYRDKMFASILKLQGIL